MQSCGGGRSLIFSFFKASISCSLVRGGLSWLGRRLEGSVTGTACTVGAGGGERLGSKKESDMARSVDAPVEVCSRTRDPDREGVTGVGGVSPQDGDFSGLLSICNDVCDVLGELCWDNLTVVGVETNCENTSWRLARNS